MDGGGVEVWSGCVNTWEIDRMGHMNVRFYIARSVEGLASFAAELGMPGAFSARADSTLILGEQHVRFLREARSGASLAMTAGVVEMGECDARLLFQLNHLDGQPAATFQMRVTHATSRDGRAFPWPTRIRERAEQLRVEVPPQAAARSLSLDAVEPQASLSRAQELGLKRISMGVIGPSDCDVFGRMRPEIFMSRISDGMPRLFHLPREAFEAAHGAEPPERPASLGGAALEYRLIYLAWPQAGDRYEMRSGIAGYDDKTRRIVHWMLDPDTGRAWGAAVATVVSFDLQARKAVSHTPEARALLDRQLVAGLTL